MSATRLTYPSASGSLEADRDLLGSHGREPGALEQRRRALCARHGEGGRARGLRRRQVAVLDEAHRGSREERVALHRPPDRQREAAAGTQDAAGLGERGGRVDHEHVAEPAQHAVDRVGVELDPLGVHHAVLDVAQPALRATPARGLDHRRREVGGEEAAPLADRVGRVEAGLPDAGGELEHRVARPRGELAHHPLAHGSRGFLDLGAAALPGRRDRLRDLVELPSGAVRRLGGHPVLLGGRAVEDATAGPAAGESGVLPRP